MADPEFYLLLEYSFLRGTVARTSGRISTYITLRNRELVKWLGNPPRVWVTEAGMRALEAEFHKSDHTG